MCETLLRGQLANVAEKPLSTFPSSAGSTLSAQVHGWLGGSKIQVVDPPRCHAVVASSCLCGLWTQSKETPGTVLLSPHSKRKSTVQGTVRSCFPRLFPSAIQLRVPSVSWRIPSSRAQTSQGSSSELCADRDERPWDVDDEVGTKATPQGRDIVRHHLAKARELWRRPNLRAVCTAAHSCPSC